MYLSNQLIRGLLQGVYWAYTKNKGQFYLLATLHIIVTIVTPVQKRGHYLPHKYLSRPTLLTLTQINDINQALKNIAKQSKIIRERILDRKLMKRA